METLRIDKWLFYARFFKTRGLAAKCVTQGRIRLNTRAISKPGTALRVGDVLTLPLPRSVVVIEICALATRRGPATEAQTLYKTLDV